MHGEIMKRVWTLLAGALIAGGLSVGVLAHDDHKKPDGKQTTVVGELIDTACFVASDGEAKGKEHASCAKKCMASGVPAAILPEGSKDAKGMMFLLTNPTVLAPYAAQTIKVEGVPNAELKAIDVKKLSVKDGAGWKEVQLNDEHHKMSGGDAHQDHKEPAKKDAHKDHNH